MDRLWSPWRLQYVTDTTPRTGCVFCDATRASDEQSLIVSRGELAYVILNKYPYNNGHLMVVPYRHTSTFATLEAPELNELMRLTQRSEIALRQAYRLEGINIGVNLGKPAGAGIEEHLHIHLVPRWAGDTNFMTVVGETRVLPETLQATAERLRATFEKLA
ncbi:MAG TPA: HIT domain-containing protein [Vicinamibacterales bacterium]|nr:HIT domain-containing protein [Vicinamibacterales bacterium]